MKRLRCMIFVMVVLAGLLLFSREQQQEQKPKPKPELKEAGGYWYVYMDFQGPFTILSEKSKIVWEEFKKQGLKPIGPFLVVFYNAAVDNKPEDYRWAPAFPISEDSEVKPPLKKRKFEKTPAVVIIHDYDIEKLSESNLKAREYIKEKGYKEIWPIYEIFHRSPSRVEIIYPVEIK